MIRILIILVIFSIYSIPVQFLLSREKREPKEIVENIEVNWWQVPIFVLDEDGNPVMDLKDTDIEIRVNNRPVEAFSFYKRTFSVSREKDFEQSIEKQTKQEEQTFNPLAKNRMVFLLFDVSLSAITCTKRSKEIAAKLIQNAEPGIQFVALTIEPFKGLNHIFGPSDNKIELLQKIRKKVKGKPNNRIGNTADFFDGGSMMSSVNRTTGGIQNRITSHDAKQLKELVGTFYLRKNRCFFDSFKSLYLIFNSMADNKFVYFFTEGLSNSIKHNIMGGPSLYNFHLQKIADYLGRSGAVLFIVNPMGVGNSSALVTEKKDPNSNAAGSDTSYFDLEKSISGENWLRYLAFESGGTYLEGDTQIIVNTLEHLHRAYYEISFPDLTGLKGNSRHITIKPKRKHLTIHSLRSLEKPKKYTKMTKIEKEMVVLNIVVRNPIINDTLTILPAQILHLEESGHQVIYTISLPTEFIDKELDLYKLRLKGEEEVISINMEKVIPLEEKLKIKFDRSNTIDRKYGTYFVLVDGITQKVLARVIDINSKKTN